MSHRWRMKCPLAGLRHGELSDTARQRLEAHVAQCPTCRDTLRHWEAADRLLHAARPQPVALSADTARTIFARALQDSGVHPTGRPRSDWRRSLLWGIGLTFLAVIALLSIRQRAPHKVKLAVLDKGRTHASAAPESSAWRGAFPKSGDLTAEAGKAGPANGATSLQSQRHDLVAAHSLRRRRHRHRHRHHPLNNPVLPLETDPVETNQVMAATTIEPQEPQGRLLVVVTHEPGLSIEVSHAAEDAPGYAQAACFQRDAFGAGIWQRCTVRKDEAGADTVQTQLALATPGLQPELLLVQTVTGAGNMAGNKKERTE